MQSNLTSRSSRRRSGFTLIELMVVILIIGILSGIVLTAMSGSDNSRALDAGVTRIESLFSLARSAAITLRQPTRVLISFDNSAVASPTQVQRFLRYATVVYKDENGDWQPYTEGVFLPEGIYFSPALSSKGGASSVQLERWDDLAINFNTLTISQPLSDNTTSIGPFNVSGNTETFSGAEANRWLSFEFNPNGTFAKPGARVVVLPGILDAGQLLIPLEQGSSAADIAKGFVIFRSGKTYFFQSGEQIKEGN